MKKLLLAMGATLLVGVSMVSAQGADEGLTLDTAYELSGLGLRLILPSDWVQSETSTDFAVNEQALADWADGDTATPISGLVLSTIGVTYEDADIPPTTTLDELVDLFAESLEEKEARADISILGRRVVVVFGTSKSTGSDGILAVWTQGETIVGFALAVPEGETYLDYALEFGQILGALRPLNAEDIFQVVTEEITTTSINVPEDWTYNAYPEAGLGAFFANEDDQVVLESGGGALNDVVILVLRLDYSAYGLEEDATLVELQAAMESLLFNPVFEGEFLVNGLSGLGYSGDTTADTETSKQTYNVVTLSPEDQKLNVYIMSAEDEDIRSENVGTFLFILSLIKPVE